MIKLVRDRTINAIPQAFRGSERAKRELTKLALWKRDRLAGKTDKDLTSALWKPAKAQLKLETDRANGGGKCAFCESRTVRFHCDVEHFRPKKDYWWLALCWENYTFSCQLCNQVHKNDRFDIKGTRYAPPKITASSTDAQLVKLADTFAPDPIDETAGCGLRAYRRSCKAEKAGMIHPYEDDPEAFFSWKADETKKQVKPIPAAKSGHKKWVAQNTIDTLGLAVDELSTERWRVYTLFIGFCAVLKETAPETGPHKIAKAHIESMTADDAAYAGMCRYFRRSFGL